MKITHYKHDEDWEVYKELKKGIVAEKIMYEKTAIA
jgi:hypothetical protein